MRLSPAQSGARRGARCSASILALGLNSIDLSRSHLLERLRLRGYWAPTCAAVVLGVAGNLPHWDWARPAWRGQGQTAVLERGCAHRAGRSGGLKTGRCFAAGEYGAKQAGRRKRGRHCAPPSSPARYSSGLGAARPGVLALARSSPPAAFFLTRQRRPCTSWRQRRRSPTTSRP